MNTIRGIEKIVCEMDAEASLLEKHCSEMSHIRSLKDHLEAKGKMLRTYQHKLECLLNIENTEGDSDVTKESCDSHDVSPAPITVKTDKTSVEGALASTPETERFYCYNIKNGFDHSLCISSQCDECKRKESKGS